MTFTTSKARNERFNTLGKSIFHKKATIAIIFFLVLIGSIFANTPLFVDSIVLPKHFCLLFLLIPVSGISIWCYWQKKVAIFPVKQFFVLLVPLVFILVHDSLIDPYRKVNISLLSFALLLFFFSTIRQYHFAELTIVAGTLQALYAFAQFVGLAESNSRYFNITGSFDNPVGVAILLSLVIPFVFNKLLNSKGKSRILFLAVFVFNISVLILTGSRAGILATIASCGWLFYQSGNQHITKFLKLPGRKLAIVLTLAALLVCAYFLKKDSANGRLLIWKVSLNMVSEKPLFGYGGNGFKSNYMLSQAEYFEENPDSPYAKLAGNVSHPFNEYLLLMVNYGIIGFLVVVGSLFLLLFKYASSQNIRADKMGAIIALLVMSLFTYPLRYPSTWVIMAFALAQTQFSTKTSPRGFSPKDTFGRLIITFTVAIVVVYSTITTHKILITEKKWKETVTLVLSGENEKAFANYSILFNELNNNPLFLYNYASELYLAGEYEKSLQVINKCRPFLWDYETQLLKAENLFGLKQYQKAVNEYKLAANMYPSMFKPLFRQFQLYAQTGDTEKQTNIALTISEKYVKILNPEVMEWKQTVKEFLYGNK